MTSTIRRSPSSSRITIKLVAKFALFIAFALMITAPSFDMSSTGDAYAQRRRSRDRDDDPPRREEPRQEAQAPAVTPAINASTPFGQALASCDQSQAEDAQFALPGLKGEIKLDRCYRGRKHLSCRIDTVINEGKALTDEYTRIVEAKYQEVTNLADICKIDFDALAKDAGGATEFAKRFAAARAEYDARSACATKVKTSVADVTLPELVQAPEVLKSMMDAVESEITRVSTAQKQVTDLAGRIEASYKSILVLQKIHRAMCVTGKQKDAGAASTPNATPGAQQAGASSKDATTHN